MRIGVNLRDEIDEIMRGLSGSGFIEGELGDDLEETGWSLSAQEHGGA